VVVYASSEVLTPTAGITFAWTISDLLPGDSGVVQVRATVDPSAQSGSVILNQAQITTTIPDLAPANNIASVTTMIRPQGMVRLYLPLVLKNYP